MGNYIIGWSSNVIVPSKEEIQIFSKDKLFSQSSISSGSCEKLIQIEDMNVQPFGEQRFRGGKGEGKKKKKSKKISKKKK
jgi:hypothetical protein